MQGGSVGLAKVGLVSVVTDLAQLRRMSRAPWNFGSGPMIIRLRSRFHHDGQHRQSARRHAAAGRLVVLVGAGGR